jgi:pimeloyl-ACP methyl ester carboxylesterase
MPPSVLRLLAGKIPGSQSLVVPEVGHSAYWETPQSFNAAVLSFLSADR